MNKLVQAHLNTYPSNVRLKLADLRLLVFQIASDLDLGEITGSLK